MVKKVDPYGKRTLWVYNKLYSYLESQYFSSTEVNRHFQINFSPNSFWITLLSQKEHEEAYIEDNFLEMLQKAEARDREALDKMKVESR